ncbi:MAG: hypothetical protein A2Z70_01295 [Chloroflexi bacterium RBG_13_48_17]|nr:MAG: hypothetical protein A2Z70_01295 [Chloroflexi bacterium RBG_13_48_17]
MKLFWLLAIIGGIFFIEGTVSVVIGGFSGSIAGLGLATGGFLRCLIGGIAPFSLIPIIPHPSKPRPMAKTGDISQKTKKL